jgi:hypothetical protein
MHPKEGKVPMKSVRTIATTATMRGMGITRATVGAARG